MMRLRRRLLCVAVGASALALIFLVAVAFLPKFINRESVRNAVESGISEELGAQISYRSADLFFFPRPGVIFRDGTVILPDRMSGSFDSLTVHLKILALLRGRVGVSAVLVTAPKVSIRLEERPLKIPTLEELRVKLQQLLKTLAERAPGLGVAMRKGSLALLEGERTVFLFAGLDADIVLPPRGLKMTIAGTSNFAKTISVTLKLDQESLSGKGEIDLRQIQMQPLSRHFMSHGPVEVNGSGMDLKLVFSTSGMQMIEGEVSSSLSYLTLKRKGKDTTIRGDKLKGDFRIRDNRVEASLRELDISDPRLVLAGTLLVDRNAGQISLNIEGRGIDVHSTRKAAYSFAGDIPIVQNIFSYVRGGTIPRIAVSSQAASAEKLGNTENIRIRGRIEKGEVFVEGPSLDFKGVSGNCVIINGILNGTDINAVIDNAQLQRGTLRVGLKGAVVPLDLDTQVEVELTTLQNVLLRLLKNKAVVHEISLMKQVKGRARGRLIMSGDSASPAVVADVREVDLFADYLRIPYPVRIFQGEVFYDGSKVATKNLRGAIGGSSFSGITASLELEKRFLLDISSGSLNISLPEVHRWLGSYETLRPVLKQISSVQGTVSLSSLELKGPLLIPEEWHFRTRGSGRDIAFTSPSLPGGMSVTRTNIEATETRLTASGAEVQMLDSSVDFSGEFSGYLKNAQRLDLTMKGFVGPESFRWISDELKFPSWLRRSLRLSVSSSHLIWEKDKTAFSGAMTVAKGPEISLDIARDTDRLRINRLFIEDSTSRATISLTLNEHNVNLGFSGKLTGKTVENVVDIDGHPGGWISGNFHGEVSLDRPVRFSATGEVAAGGFVIPWKETEPVEIDRFSAGADGERFRLDSCDLRWGNDSVSLRGNLISSPAGVLVDMDASTAVTDVGSIREKLKKIEKKEEGEKKATGAFAPLAMGTVKFRSGILRYGKIEIAPISAKISLDSQGTSIEVKEANFCGISLPGRLSISGGEIHLDFRPAAKNESVEATLACLSRSFDLNEHATGTFSLSGNITGKGGKKDIVRSISGDIDFTARNGRIYNEPSILKILAFLEVTQIVKGYADMWRKGLAYDKVVFKGTLRHDRIEIDEGFLDSSFMKMVSKGHVDLEGGRLDVKVLVSPMRTVDRIIEKVPVLGWILGNTLLSIPVRVTGDLKNPQVNAFSLSSADSGLLGIMKKFLSIPFKVFTPFLPGKQDSTREERDNAR